MEVFFSIAKDYTIHPGPRYERQGPWSAEKLMKTALRNLFKQTKEQGNKLIIDLDGTKGYATSFLEEIFGGLAREFGASNVLSHMEIKSTRPRYKDESYMYIDDVKNKT
jgi:hypothetical protein